MAILGKNGLFAGAIYLAALFGLYGMKNVSFKDSKEIDAMDIIVQRKGRPSKEQIKALRAGNIQKLYKTNPKRYTELLQPSAKTGKQTDFVTSYNKKEWLR